MSSSTPNLPSAAGAAAAAATGGLLLPPPPPPGGGGVSTKNIPLSLGKPSLRRRLEAYYRIVAPHQISNTEEWLLKMDQIYETYGGSERGEQKLARKLTRKYGNTSIQLETVVSTKKKTTTTTTTTTTAAATAAQLLLEKEEEEEDNKNPIATTANTTTRTTSSFQQQQKQQKQKQRDESWYLSKIIRSGEESNNAACSGGMVHLDMTSPQMDPRAVLQPENQSQVERVNASWMLKMIMAATNNTHNTAASSSSHPQQQPPPKQQQQQQPQLATLLDRVELFAAYLPLCDPRSKGMTFVQRKTAPPPSRGLVVAAAAGGGGGATTGISSSSSFTVPRCFAEIAEAVTENYKTKKNTDHHHPTTTTTITTIGPMALLWRAMQERFPVRILIRYGKRLGLRGTLTGFVMAMDKHWNILLQDATEVYSTSKYLLVMEQEPTTTYYGGDDHDDTKKKGDGPASETTTATAASAGAEVGLDGIANDNGNQDTRRPIDREIQRRQCDVGVGRHRRRSLPQVLVRGDTIVLVYRATSEICALRQKQQQQQHDGIVTTRYRARSVRKQQQQQSSSTRVVVGTPGTCLCPCSVAADALPHRTKPKKRTRRS